MLNPIPESLLEEYAAGLGSEQERRAVEHAMQHDHAIAQRVAELQAEASHIRHALTTRGQHAHGQSSESCTQTPEQDLEYARFMSGAMSAQEQEAMLAALAENSSALEAFVKVFRQLKESPNSSTGVRLVDHLPSDPLPFQGAPASQHHAPQSDRHIQGTQPQVEAGHDEERQAREGI